MELSGGLGLAGFGLADRGGVGGGEAIRAVLAGGWIAGGKAGRGVLAGGRVADDWTVGGWLENCSTA